MIAEENLSNNEQPKISISKTNVISLIIESMKQNVAHFKNYIASGYHKKKNLNEDDLTQIYFEQAQILIRKQDYPFNIGKEYRDCYELSKGFSDIYFFAHEQGVSNKSLFSVECKRLPAPDKAREREYVLGTSNNGGIERYKTEMHGKGLNDCGLIGFIEKEKPSYWFVAINNWITDLANTSKSWKYEETLSELNSNNNFCFLESIAYRKTSEIKLSHLWIIIN